MLPVPTRAARWAFLGAQSMLILGLLASSPPVVTLAGVALVLLALCLAVTMPLGRRVRRQRLEFAWWLGHGGSGGAVVPHAPFVVRCYIRNRAEFPLVLSQLVPLVPRGAKTLDDPGAAVVLGPLSRTEFDFHLSAPAAGRVVLHGLSVMLRGPLGLFTVPLYFPNPLALKVLPRAAASRRDLGRAKAGLAVERASRTVVRRRGGGTELYELRELQPGDPFKSIAWKASARAGKLMVREVESEVQETHHIVVDVGGSMRGGEAGMRKLDFAIEAAAAEARRALDAGDRVGLLTVDGRVLAHVPARDGVKHMSRVYEALLAATEVVDQDLTDVSDADLLAIVGRYVRSQDGIDYAARNKQLGWEASGLVRHAQDGLQGDTESTAVVASSPASSVLRRYCRARGIPLPYREDTRDTDKAVGLARALTTLGGSSRTPSSIALMTDFDGVIDHGPLLAAVRLLKAHGHSLAVVFPDATTFVPTPARAIDRRLFTVYGRAEERRFLEARAALGRLGVPVLRASATDPIGLVISRAQHLRRVA